MIRRWLEGARAPRGAAASRLTPALLLLGSLAGFALGSAAAETTGDPGATTRAVVLRATPSPDGAEVANLPAGTPIDIGRRERLWAEVRTRGPDAVEGWLRLTELRYEGGAAPSDGGAGQGLAGFSRSITALFDRLGKRGASRVATTTTIGVRGVNAADLEAARPDYAALERVERIEISDRETVEFAKSAGLSGMQIPYLEVAGRSPEGRR